MSPDPLPHRRSTVRGPGSPSGAAALRAALAGPLTAFFLLAGCGEDEPPTYAGEVAGILHANCAACHRPEGPGPMPLLTYEDARSAADLVARVTAERRMPPWMPAHDAGIRFRDERLLTDREIATLQRWAEAGAPRGDESREPPPPEWDAGWALGEPDLVIEMDESYQVPAHGDHDYFRNFVIPVPLDQARWVRAVELLPDNPAVVHHATMRVDPTPSSRLAAQADPEPGFDALVAESAARPPAGFFVGWTPGLVPSPFPEGTAWQLEPGMDMVVNAHLWPLGTPQDVRLRIGLHFSDREPTRVPTILRLGAQTIDIPPGADNYVVGDTFQIPVAVQAIGAYPHAHFLARTMEVWGETPQGRRIPLMEIPDWDFNWQDAYYYAEPIDLPAGTTLHMRYRYDNSADNPRNPNHPPERVLWGLNSMDEMAEFWLQVVTDRDDERRELVRVAELRDLEKQIEGWEHLARVDPGNPDVEAGLGDVARARGQWDEALRRYDLALEGRPGMTMAHHGRGLVLEATGDLAGARAAYQAALDALPTNLAAMADLGRLHHAMGEPGQARQLLERAVAMDSTFAGALTNLGAVLLDQGETADAERRLRQAVDLDPESPEAHFNLALTLASAGRGEEALQVLHRGVELDGSQLQPAVSVAWILATDPDPSVRRPALAADLALQVRDVTGPDPVVSDVAAAAFAAMGSWVEAIQLADEAIAAAREMAPQLVPELEARRALYRQATAFVRPERP